MNKQSISFKADEQKLTKTGGIEHYASNIVAYIEAAFDLGANWNGYDSVRAVWSNDYLTDISTVLDPNGKCIVPTEVLTDTGNVTVNLVGSIADGDTLTDRLTTYPCKAVIVDADAKVEGDETESITPSQFEQFVEIVHDEVEQVTGMTAEAETLPAGSDATASYSDGVLSLGIPQGIQGEQGEQGETGHAGAPAGFGNVTASVDNTVGTPSVVVTASGPNTAKDFDFAFHNLKGDKGDTGETGATGNGIASTVLNPNYTLTITFTDGTSYTTPSIRGAKGDTGNTGATGNGIQSTVLNADYTLTITFTDGTSYTTPSIRGEQGPAGPVSDVTVNGTSVVDQNGVAVITMPELVKTVNGNPIVVDDAFGPVKNLTVELLPIQAGTGTPSPQNIRPITGHDSVTVTDTGKNLFNGTNVLSAYVDVGTNRLNANADSRSIWVPIIGGQTYTISKAGGSRMRVAYSKTEPQVNMGVTNAYRQSDANLTQTTTAPADAKYLIAQVTGSGDDASAVLGSTQVEVGNTATTYEPYHGQSKTVTLPHTVYGAGVGVTSGSGKEKWANIPSYNGETITEPWLSSMDEYVQGTTPTTGAQVVYTLATPTDLSTTPTDITLYNGDNVISSDGDMELSYVQDMAIVIEKLENLL